MATMEEFGMQNALSDAQALALASNALMITYTSPDTSSNRVTTDVMLARNVSHGVSVTWSSSAPNVIAVSGEVTRPAFGEANVTVTLTATLSRGAESATKSFTLTVFAVGPLSINVGHPNLIDINNLQQLNAIRYDLNGDGLVDNASNAVAIYTNAFPRLDTNQSYRGYELMSNLDFASSVWASNYGDGQGWEPIGTFMLPPIPTSLLEPSLRAITTSSPVCTSIDLALIT